MEKWKSPMKYKFFCDENIQIMLKYLVYDYFLE